MNCRNVFNTDFIYFKLDPQTPGTIFSLSFYRND